MNTDHPKPLTKKCKIRPRGVGKGSRDPLFIFWDPLHISGLIEATFISYDWIQRAYCEEEMSCCGTFYIQETACLGRVAVKSTLKVHYREHYMEDISAGNKRCIECV